MIFILKSIQFLNYQILILLSLEKKTIIKYNILYYYCTYVEKIMFFIIYSEIKRRNTSLFIFSKNENEFSFELLDFAELGTVLTFNVLKSIDIHSNGLHSKNIKQNLI